MAEQFRYTDINPGCTNTDLGFLRTFYGPEAAHHVMRMRNIPVRPTRGAPLSEGEIYDQADLHFLQLMQDEFGITSEEVPVFYYRQIERSNAAVYEFIDTVFPGNMQNVLGLRNEVENPQYRPSERLERIAKPRSDIEQFEVRRQLIMSYIAGHIEMSWRRSAVSDEVSILQQILNAQLFDPHAHTQLLTLESFHDNVTNQCVDPKTNPNCHRKYHNLQTRYIDGIGYVLTQSRQKKIPTSILKALTKGQKDTQGILDPFSVEDLGGIMFVTLGQENNIGGTRERDLLAQEVVAAVSPYTHIGKPQEDQITSDVRSNGKVLNWRRLQLPVGDKGGKIELQFYDWQGYLDNLFNLSEQGNRAHKLYQVTRSQSLLSVLFPEQLYHDVYSKVDIQRKLKEKEEIVRKELLAANRY